MSKCRTGRFGAGVMLIFVTLFALVAPVGAEASVSDPGRHAVTNRSLMMCAALYGPRRDLFEDRCESLPEVPRRTSGRVSESVPGEVSGDWRVRPNITISQTNSPKEVLE